MIKKFWNFLVEWSEVVQQTRDAQKKYHGWY